MKAFNKSDTYLWFQQDTGKTIGTSAFRLSVCNCVRPPGPQSCVDLRDSALDEYCQALNYAITLPDLDDDLEDCTCPTYQCRYQQEADEVPSGERIKMIEDCLKARAHDFVRKTV